MAHILFTNDFEYTSNNRNKCSWLNLSLFHKVLASHRGYGETTGISARDECFFWMCNNLSHTVVIHDPPAPSGQSTTYFYFSHEEDLLRFKLSEWGARALQWTDK